MSNKALGIAVILIMAGLIITGIFDPNLAEPNLNPIIDKLEISLGLALVVFGFWAGGRLIVIDRKNTAPKSEKPGEPQ